MGIDVSLKKLSDIIRNISIGKNGYAFMYSKDGTILAHPNTNLNFKNITKLNQEGYELNQNQNSHKLKYLIKDYNKLINETNSAFESNIDGKAVIVNIYSSPYTGWNMASVVPKSELLDKANKAGYFILFAIFCVFVFAIILTFIVTKKLTRPITELIPLMQKAGEGDLSVNIDVKTKDEFGVLGNCFNGMIRKLNSSYEELTAVYEELTATEEELRAQYDELQYNEEALRNSDERYKLALDGANDSIWEYDLATGEFFVSEKFFEIIGYELNRNFDFKWLFNELVHEQDIVNARRDFEEHIKNITPIYKSEFRIKICDDSYLWVSSRGKALRDSEGKAMKLSGSITDISERKNSEEKIKFMAYYDSLTKLPNRTLFMNELDKQLQHTKLLKTEGAVFFIDLDNFKNINDTMGHDFGDKLLIYLGSQLENLINENDTLCRLGGDEFILLHPNCNVNDVEYSAKRLLNLFNTIFEIDNKQMYITASIGIAFYPKDGSDTTSILKSADSAMYKAKEFGKKRIAIYDAEMYLQLERKINIERILRTSIENNELSIQYQPQINAEKNVIHGFEALLRLNSKELGFISPVEFIPIAEEIGYISHLDQWVLSEACKQSKKWLEAGYKFSSISVNISSVEIQQPNFLEVTKNIIAATGIASKFVELEITETVLMQSLDSNVKILRELMDMGIRIALDDFGTGYSSLNYLRKIPISTLKIDKSFIDNINSNIKEESIIKNIIEMAHTNDLKVVAEGVETQHQLSILKERKCDYIQGYYFSKPLPASEIEKLFKKDIFF